MRFSLTRQGFVRADRVITQEAWQGGEYERRSVADLGQHAGVPLAAAVVLHQPRVIALLRRGRSVRGTLHSLAARRRWFRSAGGSARTSSTRTTPSIGRTPASASTRSTSLNTRTTYQFTKELAVRAIVRYDSQQDKVLTDFLGSYDLRPGTVVYIGYGSLYQKRAYRDQEWIDGEGDYLTTQQGLFLKASYLYRF